MKLQTPTLIKVMYVLLFLIFTPFLLKAQSNIRIPSGTKIYTTTNGNQNSIKEGVLNKTIKARAIIKDDKILIKPSDETINVVFAPSTDVETVNIAKDSEIYLDMNDATPFMFTEVSLDISLISLPLIFRLEDNSTDDIPPTGQWGLRNAGLLLGVNTKFYRYNGALKKNSVTLGPYVAPTIINLNPNNSTATDEANRVGLTVGLGAMFSEKRLGLGIALGAELIPEEESLNWIYRNQMYFGFVAGYRIN